MSVNFIWIAFSLTFSLVSFLPLTNFTHWVFRIFDFVRLQLFVVLTGLTLIGIIFFRSPTVGYVLVLASSLSAILYHGIKIFPYLPTKSSKGTTPSSKMVVALSVNVKQANQSYEKLIALVKKVKPDILLTMETNKEWEAQLNAVEDMFPTSIKVPLENRYGIHFYTTLEVKSHKVHYLVSEEHPSINATLVDKSGVEFIFWGIHPPPPSPTEKATSRQKDAELMKVAEHVRNSNGPVIVTGDFNNVCWSKSSMLFRKSSRLKDARIHRGLYSTFPANYWLLRFPIDLLFHSEAISISEIKVLPSIDSDHLPLLSKFYVCNRNEKNVDLGDGLKEASERIIKEGKEAARVENE